MENSERKAMTAREPNKGVVRPTRRRISYNLKALIKEAVGEEKE